MMNLFNNVCIRYIDAFWCIMSDLLNEHAWRGPPKDYSEASFSPADKEWIGLQINLNPDGGHWTIRQIYNQFNINESNLKVWLRKVCNRENFYNSEPLGPGGGRGRTLPIDDVSKKCLADKLIHARAIGQTLNVSQFRAAVNAEIIETLRRKGIWTASSQTETKFKNRTLLKFQAILGDNGAGKQKGQKSTKARMEAEIDVRNFWTQYCLFDAYSGGDGLEAYGGGLYLFNWDATTYFFSDENDEMLVFLRDTNDNTPITATSNGKLGIFIKATYTTNPAGFASNPVYNVADDSMKEGYKYLSILINNTFPMYDTLL